MKIEISAAMAAKIYRERREVLARMLEACSKIDNENVVDDKMKYDLLSTVKSRIILRYSSDIEKEIFEYNLKEKWFSSLADDSISIQYDTIEDKVIEDDASLIKLYRENRSLFYDRLAQLKLDDFEELGRLEIREDWDDDRNVENNDSSENEKEVVDVPYIEGEDEKSLENLF